MRRLAILLLFGLGFALAQATWPVEVLVPGLISVRAPAAGISFDLQAQGYPPLEFPARYPGGTMPVQLFSNTDGAWSASLQISDIVSEEGLLLVPANQIHYRVNGGAWLQGNGFPQLIHAQNGPTGGWLELRIDIELELFGSEQAGEYLLSATITAETEAF